MALCNFLIQKIFVLRGKDVLQTMQKKTGAAGAKAYFTTYLGTG
jgi:hypothetical protein